MKGCADSADWMQAREISVYRVGAGIARLE